MKNHRLLILSLIIFNIFIVNAQDVFIYDKSGNKIYLYEQKNMYIIRIEEQYLSQIQTIDKKIDFDNFIIIAVIDSVRPNSGYTISIDKVQEQKNNIQIDIVYQQGNTGYNVMNQPFYIIKIPKYNKEIIFSPKKYVCV